MSTMRYSEIGSEFWQSQNSAEISLDNRKFENTVYLLSGRTALDYIVKDIKKNKSLKSVMLPSYCCQTMIEPFLRNGVNVKFYSVDESCVKYTENDCDAVLVIDYFGYTFPQMTDAAQCAKKSGKTVIYDATHRLSFDSECIKYADYSLCSYRKWFYCNCAVAIKNIGNFNISVPDKRKNEYELCRAEAAKLKAEYINGKTADKSYLNIYSQAQEMLRSDYVMYAGEPVEPNTESICEKRRKNAIQLLDGLSDIKDIKTWTVSISESDTPLFLPILVDPDVRGKLRKYLTEHRIYCPVHWPVSDIHCENGADSTLYSRELSLICDQRYGECDIKYEIDIMRKFFGES